MIPLRHHRPRVRAADHDSVSRAVVVSRDLERLVDQLLAVLEIAGHHVRVRARGPDRHAQGVVAGLVRESDGLVGGPGPLARVLVQSRARRLEEAQQGQRAQVTGPGGDLAGLRDQGVHPFRLHPEPPGVVELEQPREDPERRRLLRLRQLRGEIGDLSPQPHRVLRVAVAGPVRGAGVPARRLQRLAALLQVLGDQRRELVVAVGVELDHRSGRRRMRGGPLLARAGSRRRPRASVDG